MRAEVIPDLCIACGLCIDTCPEVFSWNEEDKAEAKAGEVPPGLEERVKEAAENCPTDAIETG
ncbi:MAG: ferredoxin [Clostridia bacterium]|nr:ferredoxin [Clostridia bacterium]